MFSNIDQKRLDEMRRTVLHLKDNCNTATQADQNVAIAMILEMLLFAFKESRPQSS